MSTNKTQNYNLHAWEPGDDFLRSEFNENFAAIDASMKAIAGTVSAEQSAREKAVAAEAKSRATAVTDLDGRKVEIVTGTYVGDSRDYQTITLGFTPKAVLVMPRDGQLYGYWGGLAFPGYPVRVGTTDINLKIEEGGFTVSNRGACDANSNTQTFYYIAFK